MSLCYLCNVLLPRFHACKRPFLRNVSASCTRYIPIDPLATHRLLPSRVSLLSNATMSRLRRPDAPSQRSCRELDRWYPDPFHCFALTVPGKADCKPGRCSLGFILFRDSSGRFRPSQVPRIPTCTSAKLSDPGRTALPIAFANSTMLSPLTRTGRLQQSTKFRDSTVMASVPTPYASCRPFGATTQCSFPAGGQPLPGGSDYPPGIYCIFLHIYVL